MVFAEACAAAPGRSSRHSRRRSAATRSSGGKFEVKPARDVDGAAEVDDPNWTPDWRDQEILKARPQPGQAYLSIMATLQRHGLIAQSRYRTQAWAASDLGIRVLGYYIEASADEALTL